MNDEAKDAQQDPKDDSALQTPQPDQKHPPVFDRDQGGNDEPTKTTVTETTETKETVQEPASDSGDGE